MRLSSVSAVIESDDGEIQVIEGFDEPTWEDALDLLSSEAPDRAVSLEVMLPGVDVAELVGAGHDLGAARGELARWVEGTPWERREVLLEAPLGEPLYGAPGEPISFTLEAPPYTDPSVLPAPEALVQESTWPSAPDDSLGEVYPVVFGSPGALPERRIPGSPAVVVHPDESGEMVLLISDGTVAADTVSVRHEDDPTWTAVTVERRDDERGRATSVVRLTVVEDMPQTGWWCSWHNGVTAEGAMWDRRRQVGLHGAGELLDVLLDRTALRVDQGRMASATAQLESFRVGGYIDERVNVWEWLQSHLLPILPVSIHSGPAGLYPVVWRWQATASDALEHLSADRGEVHRTERIRYTSIEQVANEIVLDWALDPMASRHRRRTIATGRDVQREAYDFGDWTPTERRGEFTSHPLRVSHSRYGLRPLEPLSTDIVYDPSTAGAILAWKAAYHALPARMLEYEGGPELLHLELGDVVTLTDSEVWLDRQVCIVTEVRDGGTGRIGLVLRTIEDGGRR